MEEINMAKKTKNPDFVISNNEIKCDGNMHIGNTVNNNDVTVKGGNTNIGNTSGDVQIGALPSKKLSLINLIKVFKGIFK